MSLLTINPAVAGAKHAERGERGIMEKYNYFYQKWHSNNLFYYCY